jgi:hypothetical protein
VIEIMAHPARFELTTSSFEVRVSPDPPKAVRLRGTAEHSNSALLSFPSRSPASDRLLQVSGEAIKRI